MAAAPSPEIALSPTPLRRHPAAPDSPVVPRAFPARLVSATAPWVWRRLQLARDPPVEQLHLAYGHDAAHEVALSWVTPLPVPSPFVEVEHFRTRAETSCYPGYPGYLHHARLSGLSSATRYSYRVGHAGRAVSTESRFRTGPVGRARFAFTAFGDLGTDRPPPGAPDTSAAPRTVQLVDALDPALHLVAGDLSYANGFQEVWDRWFRMIEPMARRVPWMPCLGNHEVERPTQEGGFSHEGRSWGRLGYAAYRARFALPHNGWDDLSGCFYGFRYAGVQFISLDNNDVSRELPVNAGYSAGRQAAWLARTLASARADPAVDFVVVLMHHPALSSSSHHGADRGVQAAWLELFDRFEVDLVLQGHDHAYERSHPISDGGIVTDQTPYVCEKGTFYVTCGNAGTVLPSFRGRPPAWSATRQDRHVGAVRVEVDPFASGRSRRLVVTAHHLGGQGEPEPAVIERPATRTPTRPHVVAAH